MALYDPETCRRNAENLRREAARSIDPGARQMFLRMASFWDEQARLLQPASPPDAGVTVPLFER